ARSSRSASSWAARNPSRIARSIHQRSKRALATKRPTIFAVSRCALTCFEANVAYGSRTDIVARPLAFGASPRTATCALFYVHHPGLHVSDKVCNAKQTSSGRFHTRVTIVTVGSRFDDRCG